MDQIIFYLGYSFKDRNNFCVTRSIGIERPYGYDGVKFYTRSRLIKERCKVLVKKRTLYNE